MAVLVEGISVIVRRDAINARFIGGWKEFLNCIPNTTLCADENLARVGFMTPQDVETFVRDLERGGLTFLHKGRAIDLAVVEQLRGPTTPVEWLEFARISLEGTENRVAACWLFEEPRFGAGIAMPAEGIMIALPDDWSYEKSLSATLKEYSFEEMREKLKFLRRDGNIDIYLDLSTGKEVSVGRPNFTQDTQREQSLKIHSSAQSLTPWTLDKKESKSYIKAMPGVGMENSDRLNELFRKQRIRLNRGNLFNHVSTPKPPDFDFKRVEGMLLGIAIGDALGRPTEGMLPSRRRSQHGEVRDYIPSRHSTGALGLPSDDTQLAFWTLEQLIEDKKFIPENVAAKFVNAGRIFGIGSTVRRFLASYKSGKPWYEGGPESAGNGALMRIAPILVPHLNTGGTDIWVDTALAAMMTHNDYSSTAACLAFVAMLWELLDMHEPPDGQWWMDRYVEISGDLEGETNYSPRGGISSSYNGPLWRFVQERLTWAYGQNLSAVDAGYGWYSGAYLLETVPSVIYILMRHAHDPEEAIVRAVNDTKDNDTIAAIVGAAVGALHGKDAFPSRWIENLSGRTSMDDDGRVFSLIQQARDVFWAGLEKTRVGYEKKIDQ